MKLWHIKTLLLVFFWLSALSTNAYANTPGEVEVGGYLREATLNGFSGNFRKLSEYRGKPLIITVWASWCGPCQAEMASMERLHCRFGGKQFNIIGISTDDYASAALKFIGDSKLTFNNYLDSKLLMENMLGANTVPLTLLVDKRGRVLQKVHGYHEWDSPESLKLIRKTFGIKM